MIKRHILEILQDDFTNYNICKNLLKNVNNKIARHVTPESNQILLPYNQL